MLNFSEIIPNVAIKILDRLHESHTGIDEFCAMDINIDDHFLFASQLNALFYSDCISVPEDCSQGKDYVFIVKAMYCFKEKIQDAHSKVRLSITVNGRNLRKKLHNTK